MSTSTYTWTVMSINETTRAMLVQFQYNNDSKVYNVPVPPETEDLGQWIDRYAPRSHWQPPTPITHVTVGTTGENNVEEQTTAVDMTNPLSIQNVRLKVLIQQVIDEMNNV